jgi:hypothetical protein
MSIEVRPVRIPERLGVPEAAELEAYATLGFSLERYNWGHDHFAETAAELLAIQRNDAHRGRVLFGAWDGDAMVGMSGLGWERDAEAETVELISVARRSSDTRTTPTRGSPPTPSVDRHCVRPTVTPNSRHPLPRRVSPQRTATRSPSSSG